MGTPECRHNTTAPSNGPPHQVQGSFCLRTCVPKTKAWEEPMAPEGSTIKSHGSLLLSAITQRSLHRAQYLVENAANTPSICTLVTFRLHCNHHRDSLGLSFGEWRLAISLYPFLSSQASEHLSWELEKASLLFPEANLFLQETTVIQKLLCQKLPQVYPNPFPPCQTAKCRLLSQLAPEQ